jgi:hypothetical protein
MGVKGIHPRGKHGLVDWDVPGAGAACTYCQREMIPYSDTHPTRDHTFPKSLGGRKTVLACGTCNQIKGNMLPEVWQAFMEANPRWWTKKPTGAYVRPCPVLVAVAQFFIEQRYGIWKQRNSV